MNNDFLQYIEEQEYEKQEEEKCHLK